MFIIPSVTSNKHPWLVDRNFYAHSTSEKAEGQSFAQYHTVNWNLNPPSSWLNLVSFP